MRREWRRILVFGALGVALASACGMLWPAPVPMRAVDYPSTRTPRAKCLIVFLPGMGDDAEAFQKNGFVEELQRRGLSVDLVAADATIGYYSQGLFAERLANDVMGPRRAHGYEETWLIGPSMGGFGTLFYSHQHPGEVTGVLALAPFLGDSSLIDEVEKAGGLGRWVCPPPVGKMNRNNYQREMLRWLQAATRGREPAPRLYLAFGNSDKLRRGDELLAAELPADHVFRSEGGHHWDIWRGLLVQFLDRGELATTCR
jgi:pimeloyl-ACP methyl ester carboxylesterase